MDDVCGEENAAEDRRPAQSRDALGVQIIHVATRDPHLDEVTDGGGFAEQNPSIDIRSVGGTTRDQRLLDECAHGWLVRVGGPHDRAR